jgi:GDP-L-fucose synthase
MYNEHDILITGAGGLVGSELKKLYPNAIHIYHKNFDLTQEVDVKNLFQTYKPKCIIHCAGKVGGILDNLKHPALFFDDNILMNTLMVKYAYLNKIERFIGILSSCIFPDTSDHYPLELKNLHKGAPTESNFSYGYAKRCLGVQIDSYNKEYGTKYNYLIPCNMYGEHDRYDMQKSHFISILLIKIKKAIQENSDHITLLGDGTPLRQFMHAEDLAKTIKYIIDNNIYENINVAVDENYSIHEMATIALEATGNSHLKIVYLPNTPNGQFRKDICNKKLKQLIPNIKMITLKEGIKRVYNSL